MSGTTGSFVGGRRTLLRASAAAAVAPLATCAPLAFLGGCDRRPGSGGSGHGDGEAARFDGGWVGASHGRGHLLRAGPPAAKSGAWPEPARTHRAGVVVVGGGVAGLGAARTLIERGIDDVAVLELEDEAGGNSRGHVLAGIACPLGAHYLPLPGPRADEVVALLESLGVRRGRDGGATYDERMLCHSPQERLFIDGAWRDGLLPPLDALPAAERARTAAQYVRFADVLERSVAEAGGADAFAMPTARSRWSAALQALDAVTFAAWLDAGGLDATALRWYLDYCCRDDYGASSAQVSAWAGLHYFASRHGFHPPRAASAAADDDAAIAGESEAVLTWPEGNAWLTRRMAAPLGARLAAGHVALRVREGPGAVEVDAWHVAEQRLERWIAPQAVLAVPLFVAARLVEAPSAALLAAAAALPHAPWLVANLHLAAPLVDRPGAPPSWDNVAYRPGAAGTATAALGYVDARHQSLVPYADATVLTAYWALGGETPAALAAGRARLLAEPWRAWAERVVADLAEAHPDLPAKVGRVDLMRYGHAMAVPVPGARGSAALAALASVATPQRRVHHAHSDLSAYSVFEEALFHGVRSGTAAAARLHTATHRSPT